MSKIKASKLNSEQLQAVEHKSGPLLIVAGAGTGKTTVVTERINWLISQNLAKPQEILALTFTEKAAKEMETRVDEALPYGTFGLWISTFHSFCGRILRNEALNIGLDPSFKLMTEATRLMFVKKNFWEFDLKLFRPSGNPFKFIEGMLAHFDRLKDEDISPADYLAFAKKCESDSDQETADRYQELASAFKVYEDLKTKNSVMDFSDLIGNILTLFRTRKPILDLYKNQFKYILVDEFQDTNFAQNEMLKLLVGKTGNITVVADDDQSIYRFRGAAVSNVVQFRKSYPDAKVITLTKNYRSQKEILDKSYELITHNNPDRLEVQEEIDKKLVPFGANKGLPKEKIDLIYVDRVEDEAGDVVTKISDLVKTKNYSYKDFAILVRANNQSEPFIRFLDRQNIPYQFLGPGQLYNQPEIKDFIAYLKVLTDFTDSSSLYRVLSMEVFKISQRDIIEYLALSKKANISLFEILEDKIDNHEVTNLVAMIHKHQELLKTETAGQILYSFLDESGLMAKLITYSTQSEEQQAQNITKFFNRLKAFETSNTDASVFAVVDYLNLAMDMGESPLATEVDWSQNDAVNILTIHSAKGLEFPVVFLVNLIEGRFPSRERKDQLPIPDELIKEVLPQGDFHIQEERRLFYVGMTRAKEKLFFTAANFYGEGKRERKLSPFVLETLGPQTFIQQEKKENQLPLFDWKKQSIKSVSKPKSLKISTLSYSALETFKICPLHYKLRYILKLPTQANSALSFGNSLHTTLKDFYLYDKDKKLTGESEKKFALDLLKKNWQTEGYESKGHEQEAFKRAEKFLANYLDSEVHKKHKPILLEQPFSLKLDELLRITGKIDRVDDLGNGEIEIIDYKTGANVKSQKEVDLDLQMGIYALAATDNGILNKDISKVSMSFYFFDTGVRMVTKRTTEELEKIKQEIFTLREEIEQSDFACSHSQICQNCEYKMLCNS